jgi:hypothetical protein
MHAGYPMMGKLEDEYEHIDAPYILKNGLWGTVHEIGHNHQWDSWTPSGTGESTNNWFTIYVSQKVSKFQHKPGELKISKPLCQV